MSSVALRTARQTLRLLVPDDAPTMFALDADPEVMRYLPASPHATVEDVRQSLVAYQDVYRADGFARWAAIEDATGEMIGWCGLRRQPDGEVDLGYRYRRSAWGRGLASEAARACVDYGFRVLDLPRIVAHVEAANPASIRVLEKLGLRFVRNELAEGRELSLFALSRAEWGATPG
jgi:RimJ/RimL family protein N-acetyltransferase